MPLLPIRGRRLQIRHVGATANVYYAVAGAGHGRAFAIAVALSVAIVALQALMAG
ncbi:MULTISPECIES: hypothetical protein [Mycetohabitans]|uniref:hypothetical protein n=1 Tax=Mycetohabitans TaxID=2571159 RepID=UPI001F297F1E|nr:hypothetical protein [Mycetohabitans sp. B3]MCF2133109.1 hypothetical protein [Mycetohabitans sp. B3]